MLLIIAVPAQGIDIRGKLVVYDSLKVDSIFSRSGSVVYVQGTGDISAVTAGAGLGGGGTSGAVTVDALTDFDGGIETGDDSLNIKLDGSTLAVSATGLKVNAVGATEISTDGVSADELNATGVEAELEAVLDYGDLQGLPDSTWENITVNVDLKPDADGGADLGTAGTDFDSAFVESAVIGDLALGGTAITASAAEINFIDGVTSAIQTQFYKKDLDAGIDNPKHFTADTSRIWTNWWGITYTIDSIWVDTDGSVDDFDFILVEYPTGTGAAVAIEAMQVSTETSTGHRANWFTAIDNGTVAHGNSIAIVTPADSTDYLTIHFCGRWTP